MSNTHITIPADGFLLKQLNKENPWALEALMRRYESQTFHFIHKILQSVEQAEEVTQDVFIKLWESRSELDDIESLPAWLFTVSRNRALNVLKERAARYAREENYATETPQEVDGQEEIIYREMQNNLSGFVETLPPKRKVIFRLKTEEGLTTAEISKQLNISPHTVKNQLSLSYLALRRLMQGTIYLLLVSAVHHITNC